LGQTIVKEYSIKSGSNFPLKLSLSHFDKNLKILSKLADFEYFITSKMARKTFASIYYFDYQLPINSISIMLGHSGVDKTKHYLRINDDDLAGRIFDQLSKAV
jgi:integrase